MEIIAANISKMFQSGRGTVSALSDVSFSIKAGKTLTIVGKSGSGKTTLLNCIGGLEKPEAGEITCFGEKIHMLSPRAAALFTRKNVGFVFQFGNLLSHLTVSENIAFPLMLNNMSAVKRKARVRQLLDQIDLPDAASAMPNELSGGERQRVAFARAIAHCPKMLLADEPTASLDSKTGLRLVRLMTGLSRQTNCILIVSTHDPEIMKLSDETFHLRDGKMKGDSNAD